MSITPFYAALFGLLFTVLSVRALLVRRHLQVPLGDGGHARLQKASRAHANFAEYVPLTLLLIFLLESRSAGALTIHLLCLALLAGRTLHACGVSQARENYRYRIVGMTLTLGTLVFTCLRLVAGYAGALA